MRFVRALLVVGALSAMTGCSSDVAGLPMAINDPLDLIDDLDGPLRLYVLPADGHTCDALTGFVSPEVPDLAEGMFPDAVADLSLAVAGSSASTMLEVPVGAYTVLVRGKGTDPVSMRSDVFIATACADVTIEQNETREVRLTLIPIVGMGVCGDGTPSPDEQCEDGNTTAGDGCSATCRTEPFTVNTTTAGVQNHPAVAGAPGRRWISTYDLDNTTILLRLLEPDTSAVMTPSALMMDGDIDDAVPDIGAGSQLLADVAQSSAGRIAVALTDFAGGGRSIRVVFFDQNRAPAAASELLMRTTAAAPTVPPRGAFAGDAYMAVFEDSSSSTGLSGQVFAAGSNMPLSDTPFEVGQGATAGARPVVAGASDHFLVAFEAGGDVFLQRFNTDGAPRDDVAIASGGGAGTKSQAAVAAQPDGRALFAWRDSEGDGAGTSVRALAFGDDGTAGTPFVVNTTTAGDQGAPTLTAGGGVFAIVFASGGGVRGRVLSGDGDPIPNHDLPPTTADFEVAPAGTEMRASSGGAADELVWMTVWNQGDDIRARVFPLP